MQLDVPHGSTLGGALEQAYAEIPPLREIGGYSMFAIGNDYATVTAILEEGSEISIIPPVQGG